MDSRRRWIATALVAALVFVSMRVAETENSNPLVAQGERFWTQSQDAANPVACATCHFDPASTKGWAVSFPKWRSLPPPHARVMTLLQANAEAVERHYRLDDARPAATAITAYLTAQAEGMRITLGIGAGQPVLPERLKALAGSVARGRAIFEKGCQACHDAPSAAASILTFPRNRDGVFESFEVFAEQHITPPSAITWDSPAMADLIAYLKGRLEGQPLKLKFAGNSSPFTVNRREVLQ